MRKIVLYAVAVVSLAVLPSPLAAVNTITHTATYDYSHMTLGTDTLGGVAYATIHYDDMYNGGNPGMPSLPIDYIRFSVPWNATNFTVSATTGNSQIANLGPNVVYPCQPPRLMNDTTPVVITLPDSSTYFSNSYYPSRRVWVVDEGYLAGENHIVTVAVMPISCQHRKIGNNMLNRLRNAQTVQLTLSYELSDSLAMYPIIRRDTMLRQEGFALTQSMVVNPSNVATFAPTDVMMDSLIIVSPGDRGGEITPPIIHDDTISINGGDVILWRDYYPYLIVTTSDLKHTIRRLTALKRQKGFKVMVVTIDEILSDPYANQGDRILQSNGTYAVPYTDDAGKLRQYLRYCYKYHGTQYVLLAGNDLPFRIKDGIPTDWYYSDLNCDFSKDCFDSQRDSCDFYAELNIGRLFAKTPKQIDNYTDKLLNYELNPGHGDYAFLRKAIVTQGRELEVFNNFHYLVTNRLPNVFPYVRLLKEQEDQNFPTGKNIIDSINYNKYGFICSLNHGSPYGINVYGFGCDSGVARHFIWAIDSIRNAVDSETNNGLNNLHNNNYPMIYYSISCQTMPFGYNGATSFGESFTMGKGYGGPVFIGYTTGINNGSAFESLRSLLSYIPAMKYNLGKAYSYSKKGHDGLYLHRCKDEALSQNYLGDPSIEMWSDIPQVYSNVTVTRSDSTITLSGIDSDSTTVVVLSNSSLPITRMSLSSPLKLKVSPNSSIMLYKHNYIPYIAPLLLQKVTLGKSQYVIASDVTAGNLIDTNRTNGDVIVKNGVEYEIEASGTVTLQDGFTVEKGATFAVYPSSF